jgi:hypothetical protein
MVFLVPVQMMYPDSAPTKVLKEPVVAVNPEYSPKKAFDVPLVNDLPA